MFLRCEFFDAEKAAIRLVRHLDFVLEIFDQKTELLGRAIRLDDLAPRSMKLLRTGCLQLLPVRDNSGRRVFAVSAFKEKYEVVDRVSVFIHWNFSLRVQSDQYGISDTTSRTQKEF